MGKPSTWTAASVTSLASYASGTSPNGNTLIGILPQGTICTPPTATNVQPTSLCYGGYYLPSLAEAQMLGYNIVTVNNAITAHCPATSGANKLIVSSSLPTNGTYWTSTEIDGNSFSSNDPMSTAFTWSLHDVDYDNGFSIITNQAINARVRPIRMF